MAPITIKMQSPGEERGWGGTLFWTGGGQGQALTAVSPVTISEDTGSLALTWDGQCGWSSVSQARETSSEAVV